jgi:hypothetical protein
VPRERSKETNWAEMGQKIGTGEKREFCEQQ